MVPARNTYSQKGIQNTEDGKYMTTYLKYTVSLFY